MNLPKLLVILLCISISINIFAQNSIHEFKTTDIYGDAYDISELKGKKVLIVNTASKCGLTGQYEDLQKLYEMYKDKNFTILAFPANNFMNQEPGSNEDILEFCQSNYGVTFPVMAKTSVKGKDIDPIFEWLTSKEKNNVSDASVSWNFQKFLINENGHLENVLSPRTSPLSETITNWIEE